MHYVHGCVLYLLHPLATNRGARGVARPGVGADEHDADLVLLCESCELAPESGLVVFARL
eukprot:726302-Pyramimonas_sp.AAC.1